MSEKFDLVVIGAGSGGLAAAKRAAEYGARAVVIEHARIGGTCVNVGCVPKKVMWHAASFAHAFHDAAEYGFSFARPEHDWATLKAKRDAYIERLNGIYATGLEAREIEYVSATARFTGPATVQAGDREFTAPQIIVATGGRPVIPELPGADLGISSDGFFELEKLPRKVAVVGSGYVSVELAGVLRALGAEVDVFARKDSLLRSFDEILQRAAIESMQADGIKLHFQSTPVALEGEPGSLTLLTGDKGSFEGFEQVLWAVGREPETDSLELDAAGVLADEDGYIPTDKFQATNVAGIYAIGDVTGRDALTPVAIAAGRRLADRTFGDMEGRYLDYDNIPTVIFTHPPLATCGRTEADARRQFGSDVKVYRSEFVPLLNGVTSHKPKSYMKMITTGDDERIVGIHLSGPGVDEMLQGFAVAIRMGATKKDFDDTVAIHPTSAEELVTLR